MSRISIVDLEVFWSIGLSDEERAKPQRLLITVDLQVDFESAALSDRIEKTINYYAVTQRILKYGEGRSWRLMEKLATNLGDLILNEFHPAEVTVEVKKFIIPQTRYVSVAVTRSR
jgi:dihydroneopterin aldolase